jgi:hypothetical protein
MKKELTLATGRLIWSLLLSSICTSMITAKNPCYIFHVIIIYMPADNLRFSCSDPSESAWLPSSSCRLLSLIFWRLCFCALSLSFIFLGGIRKLRNQDSVSSESATGAALLLLVFESGEGSEPIEGPAFAPVCFPRGCCSGYRNFNNSSACYY